MSQQRLPFLIAIETDPLRYHGEHGHRPAVLESPAAEQLLARVAADLGNLLPDAHRTHFSLVGALYDQAQLLRPQWPIYAAMEKINRARLGGNLDGASLLSIGAADGDLPMTELVPDGGLPPGILQLLPCMLLGDSDVLEALEAEMEHRFFEEGQLSAKTAQALELDFGIGIAHARFMTVTDLRAMLKLQLDHFGFGSLWTLLDAALEGDAASAPVHGAVGQRFTWDGSQVAADFETFDYWAGDGSGKEVEDQHLASAYADWTREYRQYLVTLGAHGIAVTQRLASDGSALEGSFFVEDAGAIDEQLASITEQGVEELGVVAVTLAHAGRLQHFYPLQAEGLNHIHDHIRTLGSSQLALAFPGGLSLDVLTRRLRPDG